MVSQLQSITQRGVHTDPLTAQEREHWMLQHFSDLPFRAVDILGPQ